MADQSIATGHPTETWAALIASVSAVVLLVGVLYKRLNEDIKAGETKHEALKKEIETKLENGRKEFTTIGEELARIGEKLITLFKEEEFELAEIDRLEADIKNLHTRLLIIETEHKRCQEIMKVMK